MSNTVISIENIHIGDPPPNVHNDEGMYVGYFACRLGDQWVFRCSLSTGNAELIGGDVGWSEPLSIVGGEILAGVILAPEVLAWMQLCWRTAMSQSAVVNASR